MRAMTGRFVLLGLGLAVAGALVGCGSVTVPIPVNLGANGNLNVTGGEPQTKTFTATNFDTGGITIGSGNLKIDPSVVSVQPGGAKALIDADPTCGTVCAAAGAPAATCSAVCVEGQLSIKVAVGALSEGAGVCTTGDQYGPYLVTLDADGNATDITPSQVNLKDKTIAALNAHEAAFCVEVVSPVAGVVVIGQVVLNAGL